MKRREGETKEEYKKRRKEEAKRIKQRLKGKIFWDSTKRGTYVR